MEPGKKPVLLNPTQKEIIMTVLKTSPINNVLFWAAFGPFPFNAHLKLYVSFLGKKGKISNFFFFFESLIPLHALRGGPRTTSSPYVSMQSAYFEAKQYMLWHGFCCTGHDSPSDRSYKFSLFEYKLVGEFISFSSLIVFLLPLPPFLKSLSTELDFLHQIVLEYGAMTSSLTLLPSTSG